MRGNIDRSQDVSPQVRTEQELAYSHAHVLISDFDLLATSIGRLERDLLDHSFYHGVEAPRTNVLDAFVRLK